MTDPEIFELARSERAYLTLVSQNAQQLEGDAERLYADGCRFAVKCASERLGIPEAELELRPGPNGPGPRGVVLRRTTPAAAAHPPAPPAKSWFPFFARKLPPGAGAPPSTRTSMPAPGALPPAGDLRKELPT